MQAHCKRAIFKNSRKIVIFARDSIKLLLKSISTIKGAIEMKTWRMGSRGEIYIPSGGLLGEKHNPPTYSGVVYQTTRINEINKM